jgi:plasmid stabilization system protein ParE
MWSPEAIADLAVLRAYIAQDDPAAAQRVVLHTIRNVETSLPNSPEKGRPGRVPGRSQVLPSSAIVDSRMGERMRRVLERYWSRSAFGALANQIDLFFA